MKFALNHMTAPRLDWRALMEMAQGLGCVGVEFRNDLGRALFEGFTAETVADEMTKVGLRTVGLSQVYPFNDWSEAIRHEVAGLITTAQDLEAETISLIPRNDGTRIGGDVLRTALREILPMLQEADMVALVEPLGFERSSLRTKAETIEAIEAVGGTDHYKIVHDTFHHTLACETEFFPEYTGIIHVSGATETGLGVGEMEDAHRVLVTEDDRLGNIAQIAALLGAGYDGPISMEAFSPQIHQLTRDQITAQLRGSFDFIRSRVAAA